MAPRAGQQVDSPALTPDGRTDPQGLSLPAREMETDIAPTRLGWGGHGRTRWGQKKHLRTRHRGSRGQQAGHHAGGASGPAQAKSPEDDGQDGPQPPDGAPHGAPVQHGELPYGSGPLSLEGAEPLLPRPLRPTWPAHLPGARASG